MTVVAKIGAAAGLFLSHVQADYDAMQGNLVNYINGSTDGRLSSRTLTNHLLVAYLEPYGCWCHFDENQYNIVGTGHGTALDSWDQNCRDLQEGYNCIQIDADERGETCEPWSTKYPIAGADMAEEIIPAYCELVATDKDTKQINRCVEQTCIVETFFIKTLSRMIIPDQPAGVTSIEDISRENLHSEGFNVHTKCNAPKPSQPKPDSSSTGGGSSSSSSSSSGNGSGAKVVEQKKCCGSYPERFPYKPSARKCCQNKKTYDESTHECCENGNIMTIGAAC